MAMCAQYHGRWTWWPADRTSGHSSDRNGPYQGTHTDREAAIAEGRIEHAGEPFYVCGGPAIDQCLIDADDVLDLLNERAHDAAGRGVDEPICVVGNGPSLLLELLEAWCEEHVEVNAWSADREPELIGGCLKIT